MVDLPKLCQRKVWKAFGMTGWTIFQAISSYELCVLVIYKTARYVDESVFTGLENGVRPKTANYYLPFALRALPWCHRLYETGVWSVQLKFKSNSKRVNINYADMTTNTKTQHEPEPLNFHTPNKREVHSKSVSLVAKIHILTLWFGTLFFIVFLCCPNVVIIPMS